MTDQNTTLDLFGALAEAMGLTDQTFDAAPDLANAKLTEGLGIGLTATDSGARMIAMMDEQHGIGIELDPKALRHIAAGMLAAADTAELLAEVSDALEGKPVKANVAILAKSMATAVENGVARGVSVDEAADRVFDQTRDGLYADLQRRYTADIAE